MALSAGGGKPKQVKVRLTARAYVVLFHARRRIATALGCLLVLFLTYHVVFGRNGLNNWEHKRAQNRQLEKQIESLQQQNQQLEEHNTELRSDPDAIEFEARQKLQYVKPGEVIYKLNQPPANSDTAAPVQNSK